MKLFRKMKVSELNIKASTDGKAEFEGYGSVFGNIDSYNDIVVEGAFAKTIKDNDGKFPLLFMHKVDKVVGMVKECYEDKKGLKIKGIINTTFELGKMVYAGMQDGSISQFSIGYYPIKEEWDREKGINYVKEIKLLEVSAITKNFAANEMAELTSVKATDELVNAIKELTALIKGLEPSADTQEPVQPSSDTEQEVDEIVNLVKNFNLKIKEN